MEGEKKHRIGWGMIAGLIIVAGITDLINPIPILGGLISACFWILMSWYLWKTKHGLLNWRIALPEAISFVAEWIPAVSALPTVLTCTIIIIFISRFEDKTGINLMPLKTKLGTTPPRFPRKPVNATAGVRPPRLPRNTQESV